MTPLGHSLTGVALAFIALGSVEQVSVRRTGFTIAAFVLLANVPDLPLPNWGHERYDISHSLFVIAPLLALAVAGLLAKRKLLPALGGLRLILFAAAACLSHLLLDTFYNHGKGLAMFWPISKTSLALPIPWFDTIKAPLLSAINLKTFAVELVCYAPWAALAAIHFRRSRAQKSAGMPVAQPTKTA